MARVAYVQCPYCQKEYYLDQMLYDVILLNSEQRLICPFCKKEFHLEMSKKMRDGQIA